MHGTPAPLVRAAFAAIRVLVAGVNVTRSPLARAIVRYGARVRLAGPASGSDVSAAVPGDDMLLAPVFFVEPAEADRFGPLVMEALER